MYGDSGSSRMPHHPMVMFVSYREKFQITTYLCFNVDYRL